jgi:hypothetical protein
MGDSALLTALKTQPRLSETNWSLLIEKSDCNIKIHNNHSVFLTALINKINFSEKKIG